MNCERESISWGTTRRMIGGDKDLHPPIGVAYNRRRRAQETPGREATPAFPPTGITHLRRTAGLGTLCLASYGLARRHRWLDGPGRRDMIRSRLGLWLWLRLWLWLWLCGHLILHLSRGNLTAIVLFLPLTSQRACAPHCAGPAA